MQTRQRLDPGTRREIERIQNAISNTKQQQVPQPPTQQVSAGGGRGNTATYTLRIEEKTTNKNVAFVRKIIVPDDSLTVINNSTAELQFNGMPPGTIHQTLRHTGVGTRTYEAVSRMTTYPDSKLLFPAIPYSIGGVNIRGFAEDHPLLNIGSPTENSTSWGLRLEMPSGLGIICNSAENSFFATTSDAAPYSFKIAHYGTASASPVLEITSNGNLATGININTPHRGINITIPETVPKGFSVTYGININFSPLYTYGSLLGGTALNIACTGTYKTGVSVFMADTGNEIDNERNIGLEIAVPVGTRAATFFGNGIRNHPSKSVVTVMAQSYSDYALRIEGVVQLLGNLEMSAHFVNSQSYRVSGTQVVASRRTGWGAPTGTATRTTFNTATVTLSQLAERVKGIIDDLIAHGLIGS